MYCNVIKGRYLKKQQPHLLGQMVWTACRV